MKKLLISMALVALSLGLFGSASYAQSTCSITNTGPNSINTCESFSEYSCQFVSNNNFNVINNNTQNATSGTSQNGSTGSVSNNSGTTVSVIINNDLVIGESSPGACQIASVTTVTPSPSPVASPTPTATPVVKKLANTGSNNNLPLLTATVASLGTVALLSTLGISLYRNKK